MTAIRAAVFRAPHQPLQIETVELDEPHDGEVLVRTVASGICHSDLHFVDGDMDLGVFTAVGAAVLGHEGAGIVEAVGPGVTHVQPGDHVVACLSAWCGSCEQCLTGHPYRCWTAMRAWRTDPPRLTQDGAPIYPFMGIASYADKMLVGENSLVKIDRDVPLDRAALLGCGVLTGVGAALNTARVAPGSTVAVFGCGGVGLAAVTGAHIAGARMVIGVDRFASKEAMLREAHGTHFVDAAATDPVAAIRELTGGQGVDYAFEAVGRPELVTQALQSLALGGTAVMVGVQRPGTMLELPYAAFSGEKRLMTCMMGSNRFRLDIPRYIDFYRQGRLGLDAMVTRTVGLDDLNDAFAAMKAGEVARQVVVFD